MFCTRSPLATVTDAFIAREWDERVKMHFAVSMVKCVSLYIADKARVDLSDSVTRSFFCTTTSESQKGTYLSSRYQQAFIGCISMMISTAFSLAIVLKSDGWPWFTALCWNCWYFRHRQSYVETCARTPKEDSHKHRILDNVFSSDEWRPINPQGEFRSCVWTY